MSQDKVSYFLNLCRKIGKDLSNTFAKLEKLTICKCLHFAVIH